MRGRFYSLGGLVLLLLGGAACGVAPPTAPVAPPTAPVAPPTAPICSPVGSPPGVPVTVTEIGGFGAGCLKTIAVGDQCIVLGWEQATNSWAAELGLTSLCGANPTQVQEWWRNSSHYQEGADCSSAARPELYMDFVCGSPIYYAYLQLGNGCLGLAVCNAEGSVVRIAPQPAAWCRSCAAGAPCAEMARWATTICGDTGD